MTAPKLAVKGPRGRTYGWPPEEPDMWLPSITRVIGVMDKPAIPRWAAKRVAEQSVEMTRTGALEALVRVDEAGAVDVLKGAPWRERDKAGVRGDLIHAQLEAHLNGTEPPEKLTGDNLTAWHHLERVLDAIDIEPLAVERTCFGDVDEAASPTAEAGYAGTADVFADVELPGKGGRRRVRVVIDLKTARTGPYPEAAFQTAAARFSTHMVNEFGDVLPTIETEGAVILTCRADGAEVVPVDASRETAFAAFRAARHLYQLTEPAIRYVRAPFTMENLTHE